MMPELRQDVLSKVKKWLREESGDVEISMENEDKVLDLAA